MVWGDLITLEYGKPVKDKDRWDGRFPVYGTNGQIGTSDLAPLCNHASFILGRKGAYRGVHYSAVPFSVIDTAFFAEPISDQLDLHWAYYKFLTYDINSMDSGSAIPSTDRYEIYSLSVSLPSIEVQKKVVSILDSFDHKIRVNNQINDNLLQQALTIFTSWFIRFDQFSGIKPDNWETTSLDNLCSLISRGVTPKYDDASDQIVINQKCIRNHMLDLLPARRHRPKAVNEKWLKYGDLLINSTGEGTLGRSAQVYFEPYNMTVDSHVTIVRPAQKHLIFYVGMWGLLHEREIEALHTGSTGQTELPRERLKSMEILLPDRDTLIHFDESISPMAQMIIRNQRENVRLALLRDSLLPRLMSGEIDVSSVTL